MPSSVNCYSPQQAEDCPPEKQCDEQELSAVHLDGNDSDTLVASSIGTHSESFLPFRSASSVSKDSDKRFEPAPSEKALQSLSAKIGEKDLLSPALNQPRWWARLVVDTWTVEVIAGLISFAALVSIIGVLSAFENQPVPPLIIGITLNAVISSLATVSRTAIMLCIGSVLSQSKWLWFKKAQSLIDLQRFENASKGPLGSMLMLCTFSGGTVPYIAALLTVIGMGFDTFVQQLLVTQNRVVPEPASGISINSTISMTDAIYVATIQPETLAQLTSAMLADVQQKGWPSHIESSNTTAQTLFSPLRANCPTGNCIWEPYYALDICSQCRNTTEEITIRNISPNSSDLPIMISAVQSGAISPADVDGLTANFTWEVIPKFGPKFQVSSNLSASIPPSGVNNNHPDLLWSGTMVQKIVWPLNVAIRYHYGYYYLNTTVWTPQRFANIDEPVAAISFAEFKMDGKGGLALKESLECAMTYCVREYSRSVVQGILISSVTSTHYGTVSGVSDELSWSAKVNETSFKIESDKYGTGIGLLTGYLIGNSTNTFYSWCEKNTSFGCVAPEVLYPGTYGGVLDHDAWQGINLTPDFTTVFENANIFMSGIVQMYGNVSVAGSNAVTKAFVVVRWGWIALPATIVVSGLMLLGLILWQTARLRLPSWRSSLLPLLFRYVHMNDGSAEAQNTLTAVGIATNRPSPIPDDLPMHSDRTSDLQIEAKVTVTRLVKKIDGLRGWQLQSWGILPQGYERVASNFPQ